MSVTITKGHREDAGGLRGHSVGEIYPYMVSGIGTEGEWFLHHVSGWRLLDRDTGKPARLTHAECEQVAKFLIEHSFVPNTTGGVFNLNGKGLVL